MKHDSSPAVTSLGNPTAVCDGTSNVDTQRYAALPVCRRRCSRRGAAHAYCARIVPAAEPGCNGGSVTATILDAPLTSSVLVVDDHRVFAELLSGALASAGMRPVGTATSAGQAVAMARDLEPDVVVMDIQLPGQDGLAATRRIREMRPETMVAVVTAHRDPEWVVRAAQAGASGFVPKNGSLDEMIDVLTRMRADQMVVAPSAFRRDVPSQSTKAGSCPTLTRREHEVLNCLGRGMPAKAIARVLGMSVHTCRGHMKALHGKLGVESQVQAVIRAQELGLLDPPNGC